MSSIGLLLGAGAAGEATGMALEALEEPKISASRSWFDCIVALPLEVVGMSSSPNREAYISIKRELTLEQHASLPLL
jgi:hypothetical protein